MINILRSIPDTELSVEYFVILNSIFVVDFAWFYTLFSKPSLDTISLLLYDHMFRYNYTSPSGYFPILDYGEYKYSSHLLDKRILSIFRKNKVFTHLQPRESHSRWAMRHFILVPGVYFDNGWPRGLLDDLVGPGTDLCTTERRAQTL